MTTETMTADAAREWVLREIEADPDDMNSLDEDKIMSAWTAIHGRRPDDEDLRMGIAGLWTDCVAATID